MTMMPSRQDPGLTANPPLAGRLGPAAIVFMVVAAAAAHRRRGDLYQVPRATALPTGVVPGVHH
jgi:hypothetical protein